MDAVLSMGIYCVVNTLKDQLELQVFRLLWLGLYHWHSLELVECIRDYVYTAILLLYDLLSSFLITDYLGNASDFLEVKENNILYG